MNATTLSAHVSNTNHHSSDSGWMGGSMGQILTMMMYTFMGSLILDKSL